MYLHPATLTKHCSLQASHSLPGGSQAHSPRPQEHEPMTFTNVLRITTHHARPPNSLGTLCHLQVTAAQSASSPVASACSLSTSICWPTLPCQTETGPWAGPHQKCQHTCCSPLERTHHKVTMPRPGLMTPVSRISHEGPALDCQYSLYHDKQLSNLKSSHLRRTAKSS